MIKKKKKGPILWGCLIIIGLFILFWVWLYFSFFIYGPRGQFSVYYYAPSQYDIPILITKLDHWYPDVRRRAIEALVRIGKSPNINLTAEEREALLAGLIRGIQDKNRNVREDAISETIKLGISGNKWKTEDLLPLFMLGMNNPDLNMSLRGQVLLALANADPDGTQVVPEIIKWLDTAPEIREQAIFSLDFIGPEAVEAVPHLLSLLRVIEDPDLVGTTFGTLTKISFDDGLTAARDLDFRHYAALCLYVIKLNMIFKGNGETKNSADFQAPCMIKGSFRMSCLAALSISEKVGEVFLYQGALFEQLVTSARCFEYHTTIRE